MGRNYGPSSNSISPYCFLPVPCPLLPSKLSRHQLEDLATSTWEEDNSARRSPTPPSRRRSPTTPPRQRSLTQPLNTNTPHEDEVEQHTRRLDRKNGQGLAKDATKPVTTLISESHEEVVFTGDTTRGKGPLIPDNEIRAYPDIRMWRMNSPHDSDSAPHLN